MTYWRRDRRVLWCALAVVGCFGIVAVVGDAAVQVPAFAGAATQLPWAMLAPLLPVATVAARVAPSRALELVAVRRVDRLDTALCLVLSGVAVLLGWALVPWCGGQGLAAARTLAGLLAIVLIARRKVGSNAGLLVAATVFCAAALGGTDETGTVRWWAFTIAPAGSVMASLVAGGLVAASAQATASSRVRELTARAAGSG